MRSNKPLILLAVLAVSGCGGDSARQIIGLDRRAPDAFAVTTHAPLEVPANLNQLPPPRPGVARPQEVTAQQMARSAVFLGVDAAAPATAPSAAEAALLNRAGPADPNVRVAVNQEAAEDADTQSGLLDWIVVWRDKPQPGVAVNAAAEAERLKQARAQGVSPTATPTPVVEDSGRLGVPKAIQ
jgi:hypothetical protein